MAHPAVADLETFYQLLYEQRWAALLHLLHRHHADVAADARLAQAASTAVEALFADLDVAAIPVEALETLWLLHAGGQFVLPAPRYAELTAHLVRRHAGQPEAALGYARHCPEHPTCADVLRRHAEPVPAAREGAVAAGAHPPLGAVDATISLLKSQQEVDFFMAVREVFATYLVYPNVALGSLVDFDRVREELSPRERRYFFRGLVDCVVFDQHDAYRPRYFFELDSPHHDDPARQERDRCKARILTLAGQTLYRVRPGSERPTQTTFTRLVRQLVRT